MPHRGEIVEKYIRANYTLTKLASLLPFTVRTMYRHFDDPDLPLEQVLEYAKATNHDFSDEIPEMVSYEIHFG